MLPATQNGLRKWRCWVIFKNLGRALKASEKVKPLYLKRESLTVLFSKAAMAVTAHRLRAFQGGGHAGIQVLPGSLSGFQFPDVEMSR